MANLYAEHAREMAGVGPEFHMASWEHKEPTRTKPERLVVTLMTAPRLESGEIAWKYADRDGKKVVDLVMAEHMSWVRGWEIHTGKCSQCSSDCPGQEWIGWSAAEGNKFRTCPRCNGTNKAPETSPAEAIRTHGTRPPSAPEDTGADHRGLRESPTAAPGPGAPAPGLIDPELERQANVVMARNGLC